MAKNDKGSRTHAEERFDRARKPNDEAMSIIDIERDAMRKKTARLKKLRLAQEAEAGVSVIDKKPPAKKRKPPAKAKK